MPQPVSRRGFLLGSASVALLAGCADQSHQVVKAGSSYSTADPSSSQPVTVRRVTSTARNTDVDLVLIVPKGVPVTHLPVCLALHHRGGRARSFLEQGVPEMLTAAVRRGTTPFAIAAVDGAHYWVDLDTGDDPQRMLTQELPTWLRVEGMAAPTNGLPSAVLGISMGGFGALQYARAHPQLAAIATCSPALFTSWPDARKRKIFSNRNQWASHEPLRHTDSIRDIPLGVWCGRGDPFARASRQLARSAGADMASVSAGRHKAKYWRRVLPSALTFIGQHLS